jgi:RNA polymerase sigma factor for flagellar operon FliA
VTTEGVSRERAEARFLEELNTIERAIRFACRRASFYDADAEDFGSYVKLKLIENDYDVIRRFEGRSTFWAFIGVVVQRLVLDYRIHLWGRWHASAEAKRIGDTAIAVESMILRDGRSLDEALAPLQRRWPELSRADVEGILGRLPRRTPRPFMASLDDVEYALHTDSSTVEDAAFVADRLRLSSRLSDAIRHSLRRVPIEERLLLRMRFEAGMTIAEISRSLGVDQKPLYRRIKRGLLRLRTHLEECGFGDADAETVLNLRCDLDFGFAMENEQSGPSTDQDQGGGTGGRA